MVHQIVYISSSRTADTGPVAESILAKARIKNAALGLSGVLLFSEGAFFQVLEGERDVVEAMFRRIALDDSHSQLITMHKADIAERAFADWSMGGFHLASDDPLADRIKSIARHEDFTRRSTETEQVLSILIGSFLETSRS